MELPLLHAVHLQGLLFQLLDQIPKRSNHHNHTQQLPIPASMLPHSKPLRVQVYWARWLQQQRKLHGYRFTFHFPVITIQNRELLSYHPSLCHSRKKKKRVLTNNGNGYSGVAIGSSIGHAIGGLFSGGSSAPAAESQSQVPAQPMENGLYQANNGTSAWEAPAACENDVRAFRKCMDDNQGSLSICGWYLDQLVCLTFAFFPFFFLEIFLGKIFILHCLLKSGGCRSIDYHANIYNRKLARLLPSNTRQNASTTNWKICNI